MRTLPSKGAAFDELVANKTFLVVDVETTSVAATAVAGAHLRLISIAMVVSRNGTRRVDHHWLINPGVPVDPASSAYNVITTADLAEADTPAVVLTKFGYVLTAYPDAAFVCHNAGFDIGVLREEHERIGTAIPNVT
ncbi:MAG: 3'-5' exonuclease [Actinomycetes bacterium]